MAENHDLVIIGGGPAGLTATIYADRAAVDSITLEQGGFGGQIALTQMVDNYPGLENISGQDLADRMHEQAVNLGAHFVSDVAESIEFDEAEKRFTVKAMGEEYVAKSVILATGGTPRPAGFEGEKDFSGHGVSYCATCDGMFYKDKKVFVVGGGNSACEEADYLTRFASSVTMIVRKDHLRAQSAVKAMVEKNPKIDIRYECAIASIEGSGMLPEKITFRNTVTGEEETEAYEAGSFGVFVFIGNLPASELVKGMVEMEPNGDIITDETMATTTPGLFVAGDVRKKPLRQIVTATADGAQAATSAALYLGNLVI